MQQLDYLLMSYGVDVEVVVRQYVVKLLVLACKAALL